MSDLYTDFSYAWVSELLNLADNYSAGPSPRGLPTRERRWSQFAVLNPLSFPVAAPGRKFRDVIGILEGLSLVGQMSVPELFVKRVAKFAEYYDGGVFHGAYGARVAGSLGDLVDLLDRDPDSRQGVVTIFDSGRDLNRLKRDIPCTVALHFMMRGDELEMNVTMRSNDIWLGTPYDFTQFAVLQASVAQALGVKPGTYVHSAGSLHLYERDLEAARNIDFPPDSRSMAFPLWHTDSGTIGAISKRARDLLIGDDFMPVTEFEAWAWTELHGGSHD